MARTPIISSYSPRDNISSSYTSRAKINFLMTEALDFLMTEDDKFLILEDSIYDTYTTRIIPTTAYS